MGKSHTWHAKHWHAKWLNPPPGRGYEDLLGQIVPAVDVQNLLVGPCKGAWWVQLPEGPGTRCYVCVMEEALVVAPFPPTLVQGVQGHPAPVVGGQHQWLCAFFHLLNLIGTCASVRSHPSSGLQETAGTLQLWAVADAGTVRCPTVAELGLDCSPPGSAGMSSGQAAQRGCPCESPCSGVGPPCP